MAGDAKIRFREPQDLIDVSEVLKNVYNTDRYPVEGVSNPLPFLTPPNTLCAWVVTINDSIVGHALVTKSKLGDVAIDSWVSEGHEIDHVAVLGRLFIDPSARGQGLGARLAQTATGWAAENAKRLVLLVIEKDTAAIHIYEKLAWRRFGTTIYDNGQGSQFSAYLYVSPPKSD